MKKSLLALATVSLASIGTTHAIEPSSHWAAADDPVARAILAVEGTWTAIQCGAVPTPELRAAIAEDFMGTSTRGVRYGRSAALESGHDQDCRLGHVNIRFFEDALAIAYGHESDAVADHTGKRTRHCVIWTDTWLKRKGVWQVIAAQDNAVACR